MPLHRSWQRFGVLIDSDPNAMFGDPGFVDSPAALLSDGSVPAVEGTAEHTLIGRPKLGAL
jgi:hypothetical protein